MICQGRSAVHAAATNHIACVHVLDDAADSRIKWLKTLGRKVKQKKKFATHLKAAQVYCWP